MASTPFFFIKIDPLFFMLIKNNYYAIITLKIRRFFLKVLLYVMKFLFFFKALHPLRPNSQDLLEKEKRTGKERKIQYILLVCLIYLCNYYDQLFYDDYKRNSKAEDKPKLHDNNIEVEFKLSSSSFQ